MSRILLVTALRPESRAALAALVRPRRVRGACAPTWEGEAGGSPVTIVQGGVGPEAARQAASHAWDGHELIVSFGFAGALAPELTPGDVVLADAVVWQEGAAERRYVVPSSRLAAIAPALARDLGRVVAHGTLLSSSVILATAVAKRDAARRYHALAVEMEAGALADVACSLGVDFLSLRAVLDTAELSLEQLPPNLDVSWQARAALVLTPALWPLVWTLRRHVAAAVATLTAVGRTALPALGATR